MNKLLHLIIFATVISTATSTTTKCQWYTKTKEISAITIGIGFKNDTTGWTTASDSSHLPYIVRTNDGGTTWNQVKSNTGANTMIVTAIAAAVENTTTKTDVQLFGVPFASKFSLDGENFKPSKGAPIAGQDVKYQAGRMLMAGPNSACLSQDGGENYICHRVPLFNEATGRYLSSPSEKIIYYSAGNWPRINYNNDGDNNIYEINANLNIIGNKKTDGQDSSGLNRRHTTIEFNNHRKNMTSNDILLQNLTIYTAELWKSVDAGKTWKNLIHVQNEFYFNDIHCIDDNNCVVIGEGFAQDGSKQPGARIYTTSDGKTFNLMHLENKIGIAPSFMTTQMISTMEHWVGGTAELGNKSAVAFLLHTVDGGKTYTNENNGIVGEAITDIDFLSSKHGYATSINSNKICSVLEYHC